MCINLSCVDANSVVSKLRNAQVAAERLPGR